MSGTRRWRTRFLFGALYLSEGAPIGFLWWYLPSRLREAGLALDEITALTATLGVPWALKWAWAPVLDFARGPRWGYRHWMLVMQAAMVATLLPVSFLDPVADYGLLYGLCLAHAIAASTQDVAIDALAIGTVPRGERGALNGWMQAGMLLGRASFGGLAIRYAPEVGLPAVVGVLAAVVACVGIAGVIALRGEPVPPSVRGRFRVELRSVLGALASRRMFWGVVFALVAGAGFEAVGGVASVFLQDMGYAADTRGNFLAFVSVPAMIAGALLGGAGADRFGPRRACAAFLVVLAGAILVVAQSEALRGTPLLAALGLFYAAIGLFTASSYALFMDLTHTRVAATQFTAFMAMTNACEVWAVAAVGPIAKGFGYAWSFGVMAAVSLLALPVLGMPGLRQADSGEGS